MRCSVQLGLSRAAVDVEGDVWWVRDLEGGERRNFIQWRAIAGGDLTR